MFYLTYDYDEDNPDKYNNKQANESLAACERRIATKLHEAQMKQIRGGIAGVKETLITNSTTETTPSNVNVEINCDNELSMGNECSSHDPNINDDIAWEQIGINDKIDWKQIGINHSTDNIGKSLSHVPTPCADHPIS